MMTSVTGDRQAERCVEYARARRAGPAAPPTNRRTRSYRGVCHTQGTDTITGLASMVNLTFYIDAPIFFSVAPTLCSWARAFL